MEISQKIVIFSKNKESNSAETKVVPATKMS